MSKTTTIAFGDRWLWSYDLARSVLFIEVVRRARDTTRSGQDRWTDEVLEDLRLCAQIGDFPFRIDPRWSRRRLDTLIGWLGTANTSLGTREAVGPAETAGWPIDGFEWRGTAPIPTASVISLGTAVIELISGTLPAEPPDRVWCYGFAADPVLLDTDPGL